jgi:4,5-DOPA dioxygenase extradiol
MTARPPADPDRLPVLFVGHGNPMNAILDNQWSRGFRSLAGLLPRPQAIVCVSAHWYVPGTYVTGEERPETIHDFGGFPAELYAMRYPAPGDPALARRILRLVGEDRAALRTDWGLDHGTWSVLVHLRPGADVPVVQLSIDYRLSAADHLDVGRALAPLRQEGVLLLASGNIVHNLRHAFTSMRRGETATPDWASRFDADIAAALEQHDGAFLARSALSDTGRVAHPTPDHYLPLLYAAGAADERDAVRFPVTGFDMTSLSMRAVLFG